MASHKICCINGCDKPVYRSGMCNAHRIRMRRHGDASSGRRSPGTNHCGKGFCPAAKKIWNHIHYINNVDTYKSRADKWKQNNPEVYECNKQAYFSRPDIKERARQKTKQWSAANPERKRQLDAEFKAKNPAKVTSYKARYRAARRQATPPWLTNDHVAQIQAVYEEACILTGQTGTPHEVDHIVPLAGRVVSGLHVPWNLRAIPRIENNRRPRIWNTEKVMATGDISLAS